MSDASASVCQLQALSKLEQTAEKWRNSSTYSNRESRLPIQTLHLSPPYGNSPLLMVSQEEGRGRSVLWHEQNDEKRHKSLVSLIFMHIIYIQVLTEVSDRETDKNCYFDSHL